MKSTARPSRSSNWRGKELPAELRADVIANPNLFVLTGGPGSGKTTVLAELGKLGVPDIREVAREIIQEQMASGGTALPWRKIVFGSG